MAQKLIGDDRRRSRRDWTERAGQVTIVTGLRGTTSMPCRVLNTSKGGALIQVENAALVPDDFYLQIAGQKGEKIICAVVRRGRRLLGVRYVPQPNCVVTVVRSG